MHLCDTIYQHELITRSVRVAHALDPNQVGMTGTVVDESRQTLTITTASGRPRTIPKAGTAFHFTNEDVTLNGSQILFRPEDRVKRLAPRFRKKAAKKHSKRR